MSHDSYTSMTNSLFSSLQLSTCADSLCFKSSAVTFLSPFGDYVGVGDVWWVRRCSSLVVLLELWRTETCLTCKIIMLLDKYNMYRSWHNSYVFDFFLIISKIRSHEVHRKGRDCGSLWHPRRQRLIQIWSLLVPKKQDGHGSNANLEIWVMSHWLRRLFMTQPTVWGSKWNEILQVLDQSEMLSTTNPTILVLLVPTFWGVPGTQFWPWSLWRKHT